jgi:hypothetical protein
LLAAGALAARRAAAAGPLAPLAASLAADLERVLAARPEPDPRKARLTARGSDAARATARRSPSTPSRRTTTAARAAAPCGATTRTTAGG